MRAVALACNWRWATAIGPPSAFSSSQVRRTPSVLVARAFSTSGDASSSASPPAPVAPRATYTTPMERTVTTYSAANSAPAPVKPPRKEKLDKSKPISPFITRRWDEFAAKGLPEYPELPEDELEFIKSQVIAKQPVVHRVDKNSVIAKLRASLFKPTAWTPESKRTGLIARKMGMLQLYDEWGVRFPVTVLTVDDCQVIQIKETPNKRGEVNMQLGAGFRRARSTPKPQLGHFEKAAVSPKTVLVEFNVTPDAVLPVATRLTARHFLPGQYVDVSGNNRGKGFAGVMERWGFKGQPATHGVSVSHRSHGSTGQRQDPGKVFKGKKMAGRLGNERNTIQNLVVCKIDVPRNLLFIKGTVPGPAGRYLEVRDAIKKKFDPTSPPPFPTYVEKDGELPVKELFAPKSKHDPFLFLDN